MDLLVRVAGLLARPMVAALGVRGRSPEKQLDELRLEMTLSDTEDDLVLRHLARAGVWGVMFALSAPVLIAVGVVFELVVGGTGGIGSELAWGLVFFEFWISCVHGAKALIAAYLVGPRWNPANPVARFLMLNGAFDAVVALIITVVLQVWWAR